MSDGKSYKILIADDEISVLNPLGLMLGELGYICETAANGLEAVEKARAGRPDIILLDLNMPVMDGFEACRSLKSGPETANIPIIVLTGDTSRESMTKAFDAGARDYITKPFSEREFEVKLQNHIKAKENEDLLREQNIKLEKSNRELQEMLKLRSDLEEDLVLYHEQLEREINDRVMQRMAATAHSTLMEATAHIGLQGKKTKELQDALKDKETLLKEVHHRVKNNLQIISSLLSLQMNTIDDMKVMNIFRDSVNRIRSMALVHEKLYQSSDISKLDVGDYFNDLAADILQSYELRSYEGARITLDIGVDTLDIDLMIPCGLVVCELVSNAIKHAFPDHRKGELHIGFNHTQEGKFLLVVSDNGVGMPEDSAIKEKRSLGWQLVQDLVKRKLHGTIEVDRNKGTKFTITF
jgi:two-component sensor histidine kinase